MRKFLLLFALIGILLISCEKENVKESPSTTYSIVGSVQKGPFVLGSSIIIQPLNNKLNPTGQVYNTITNDDAGHFNLGSVLSSKYAEIIASGYYFDEVVGSVSHGTLSLRSITDLDGSGVSNVNLLTTLVFQRTTYLVNNSGKSIADATEQAERELFLALGIKEQDIPNVRFNKMDISQAGEHNALLLAISVALQYERSTGELSELIAKLATDLADDGQIARDKIQQLYISKSVGELTSSVRNNLIARYRGLGIDSNIPMFDKYLPYFLDLDNNGVADKSDGVILDDTQIVFDAKVSSISVAVPYLDIDSYEIYVSESSPGESSWLTIESVNTDCICISAAQNLTELNRTAEIIIKERNSDNKTSIGVTQNRSYTISYSYGTSPVEIICDAECFYNEYENGVGACYYTTSPIYVVSVSGDLTSTTLPSSIISIKGAFASCFNLSEFRGELASNDGRYVANNGCLLAVAPAGLSEYTTSADINTIGEGAFRDYTYLQSVTISENINSIESFAFQNCDDVELFTFKGTTPPTLGAHVFDGIENLTISIPTEAIDAYLVCDWPYEYRRAIFELGDIKVIPDSRCLYYTTIDNQELESEFWCKYNIVSHTYTDGLGVVVFAEPLVKIEDMTFAERETLKSIIIPNNVTIIGLHAFQGCSNLTSVTIPNSVITIEYGAFGNCFSLSGVIIPDSVISIGENAFNGCLSLVDINIPDSVTFLNHGLFCNCPTLINITIPESVTSIGQVVFQDCTSLEVVYCKPSTPPSAYIYYEPERGLWNIFENTAPNLKIYVPTESVESYKTAKKWKDYADCIIGYDF